MFQQRGVPDSQGGDMGLDTAALFAVIIEGVLYGISLPFFGTAVWALCANHGFKAANRMMLGVSLLLLVLSTVHIGINIGHTYLCLIVHANGSFCRNIREPTFNVKNAFLGIAMSVGDALTIYRVFVVWKNYWILGGLGILWAGVTACSFGTEFAVSNNTTSLDWIFAPLTRSWIMSLWILGFVCNVTATACLAYRIWSLTRSVRGARASTNRFWLFLRVAIDSAALYCLSLVIMLIIFFTKTNGQFILLDAIPPIICISFYLIIIRVHMFTEKAKISDIPGVTEERSNIQLQTVQVHIDRAQQNDINGAGSKTFDLQHGFNWAEQHS